MCHCEHDGVIVPPPKSGEGAAMRLQQPACLTHRLFDPDSETVLTHPVLDTEHTLLAELALIGVRLFGGVVR
jgi:hypothetical protein